MLLLRASFVSKFFDFAIYTFKNLHKILKQWQKESDFLNFMEIFLQECFSHYIFAPSKV